MSLVSLTIVGKASDEVRYVREFSSPAAAKDGSSIMDFEEELFGFLSGDQNSPPSRSCSIRHQFLLQSAFEIFDDAINKRLSKKIAKDRNETNAATGLWIGFLCLVEEFRFYGYMTATGIKIITATKDSFSLDQKHLQISNDEKLKETMTKIHYLYVDYLLNPFAERMGLITSRRFDQGVKSLVLSFNGSAA